MVVVLLFGIGLVLFKFFFEVLNFLKILFKKFEVGDNNWFL